MPERIAGGQSLSHGGEVLRISLLGGFRVSVDARAVPHEAWKRQSVRTLLKRLALAHGHRLHREQLYDWLWPDLSPAAADNNLRRTLHIARHVLEPATASSFRFLRLEAGNVVLGPRGHLWIDVAAFEEAAREARLTGAANAFARVRALYAGDLLPEDRFAEWTQGRRHALRSTFLDVLGEQARRLEDLGSPEAAIETLRHLLRWEPGDEDARRRLMGLYARTGRRQRALAEYSDLEHFLQWQFDESPEARTRQLHDSIRAGRCRRDDFDQLPDTDALRPVGRTGDDRATLYRLSR
ncbi:MAG TPA: BTAD domain-containing putative transcriptional regulator [Thermomicrobiaceae bacterium]|nr:BTAD domain-containing putative transcriptional regulator [Thermomicrobiaceae bacterium]